MPFVNNTNKSTAVPFSTFNSNNKISLALNDASLLKRVENVVSKIISQLNRLLLFFGFHFESSQSKAIELADLSNKSPFLADSMGFDVQSDEEVQKQLKSLDKACVDPLSVIEEMGLDVQSDEEVQRQLTSLRSNQFSLPKHNLKPLEQVTSSSTDSHLIILEKARKAVQLLQVAILRSAADLVWYLI